MAKVAYRGHDLRHTFIRRLAESPNVSEETIQALAGHVSKQMMARYSHIRNHAKAAAIAALEAAQQTPGIVANLAKTCHTHCMTS